MPKEIIFVRLTLLVYEHLHLIDFFCDLLIDPMVHVKLLMVLIFLRIPFEIFEGLICE